MTTFLHTRWAISSRCILALALCSFSACKKNPPVEVDFGYNYLPLEIGQWVEYDVDSIVYDEFAQTVTNYPFVLRETVVETFEDAEGRTAYRVERATRMLDSAEFVVRGSYAVLVDGVRAERLDNNTRIVPLIFPPKDGADWNGNAFNTKGEELFEYDYVDQPETIGSLALDSTLRVIHRNDTDNFVVKTYQEERYARNIGLVYREFLDLETQISGDSGLHWIQVLRDMGP